MDLLLTHGYFLAHDEHEQDIMRPYPPLGLLYVSSHLKARGFEVAVFDSTLSRKSELEAHIAAQRPPVVGIYVNMLTRANVLEIIRWSKAAGAKVVLGGPEAANYPRQYLERGADVVAFGEGELTLEALLPHFAHHGRRGLEGVAGIYYLDDEGELCQTEAREQIADLDAQPFPDRQAIDIPGYMDIWRTHHGMGSVSLITARGCPFRCKWCSHAVFGYTHRRRSPENVVAEVAQIIERYDPELLWYADDVFTIQHKWLYQYADAMRARGFRVPFETISREDRLNEKVVKTLADMGCFRLWIGAESGSQAVLDAMDRRTDASRVVEMVKLLQQHGIEAGMFIMLGYHGERQSDLLETVERLKAALPDVFLTTVAYPIKGTKYHAEVADQVVSLSDSWETGSDRLQTILGRHSRRYYDHTTRWMVNEVALHRQRVRHKGNLLGRARHYLKARYGRLGMALTQRQVERGKP